MAAMLERGGLQPRTLRFLDEQLETRYQEEEGRAGKAGYQIITGATVVLWLVGALVLPQATSASFRLAFTVGGVMAVVGGICLAAASWAVTMNRQHALAFLLTSANGLVILLLTVRLNAVHGYAVGGIMLLFLFGFLARTRFVFAVGRTLVIAIGLAAVIITHDGPRSLALDAFFFTAAAVASLLGLHILERNRRGLWHQRLVIEEQAHDLEQERAETERLLLNVLPASVSNRLRAGESSIADEFPSVTVLFADIVGFTPMAAGLSPAEVIVLLGDLFTRFDDLVAATGLEKIKTIGDSYLAVGGLPEPLEDHAKRAIDLGLAMLASAGRDGQHRVKLRVGVHSGPVAGGVIGTRRFAYDVWGDTVNMAARLEETGLPGRIHASEATMRLTSDTVEYEPRGPVELRGLGAVATYLVV